MSPLSEVHPDNAAEEEDKDKIQEVDNKKEIDEEEFDPNQKCLDNHGTFEQGNNSSGEERKFITIVKSPPSPSPKKRKATITATAPQQKLNSYTIQNTITKNNN